VKKYLMLATNQYYYFLQLENLLVIVDDVPVNRLISKALLRE